MSIPWKKAKNPPKSTKAVVQKTATAICYAYYWQHCYNRIVVKTRGLKCTIIT
jgi:hypothetical protein